MPVIPEWPLQILRPRSVSIWPEYRTRPEQAATNGMVRSSGLTATAFRMKLNSIPVFNEAGFRTLMATLAMLEGDRNLIKIRVPDLYGIDGPFALATKANRELYPQGVPFSSGVTFSDGVGFAVSTLSGTLSADASLASREIVVTAEDEVPGGTIISIAEFCYIVAGSWTEDGVNRVKLSPVLRKAAAAGDEVDFAPVFVGYCVTPQAGSEERQFGRYGYYSFEFVEDLTRLVEGID